MMIAAKQKTPNRVFMLGRGLGVKRLFYSRG
jgi:hypothetical protein